MYTQKYLPHHSNTMFDIQIFFSGKRKKDVRKIFSTSVKHNLPNIKIFFLNYGQRQKYFSQDSKSIFSKNGIFLHM